jgi:hypothetical protein
MSDEAVACLTCGREFALLKIKMDEIAELEKKLSDVGVSASAGHTATGRVAASREHERLEIGRLGLWSMFRGYP